MYALANVLKEGPNVSKVKTTDWGIPVAALSGILILFIAGLALAGVVWIHRHNHQQATQQKKGEGWILTQK